MAPYLTQTSDDVLRLYEKLDQKIEEFKAASNLRCPSGCGRCCENPNVFSSVLEVLPLAGQLWQNKSATKILSRIRQATSGVCVFYEPNPLNPDFALAKLPLGQAKSARRAACLDKVETCGVNLVPAGQPKANFAFPFFCATDRRSMDCNEKFGLKSGNGRCSVYPWRPLICRLFGYAAKQDKYLKPQLVTCPTMKAHCAKEYQLVVTNLEQGKISVPLMREYTMQLLSIDPQLGREQFLINTAVRIAIEKIGLINAQ